MSVVYTRRVAPFVILAVLLVGALSISARLAHAQFSLPALLNPDLTLSLSPLHPRPGEIIRVSAHSTELDLSSLVIRWTRGGSMLSERIGATSVDIVAGALGSETTVIATVFEEGFESASASARIHPTELDLLWEADSYVPPFFHGRALASAGTNLRLEAVPRFRRANGTFIPTGDITFVWKRNGYVVGGASGRGKSSATLESPSLFGSDVISVEAYTADRLFEGSTSTRIPSVEPQLVLYEDDPLSGTLYHRALPKESAHADVEMSFVAIPYFAETERAHDNVVYEWKVNDIPIGNDPESPNSITINAEGSSGLALIELALTHASNLFTSVLASWQVELASVGAGNPFAPPAP